MKKKAFFVASTGQHVGKTTACLGLIAGLRKRFTQVGFLKPVGQEQVTTEEGIHVDKDVLLFKEHFNLQNPAEMMSPVLLPSGFTRDYLDGKIQHAKLVQQIQDSFSEISKGHDIVVVEGTGHCGVGSIVNLNNAQVAALLQVPVIIVASGGLGSAFDQLALNYHLCAKEGVRVAGILLNRVLPEKRDMVVEYMEKALQQWNIPLLGCIPYDAFLSNPSMKDFEVLFNTTLLSGEEHQMRHFKHTRLIAMPVEHYHPLIACNQLIITPANREDIILATLTKYWDMKIASPDSDLQAGMILTGDYPPRHSILDQLKKAHIPTLYTPVQSYTAMKMILSFTAKIRTEDVEKIKEAVSLVEQHIDFDKLTTIFETE